MDDERSILALVTTLLKSHGHECTALDDPAAAVAMLRREPVDVLVCDAHLREAPGEDPVAEARQTDPATAIILTTRHRPIGREPLPDGEGIYDCLKKPFEMGRLPTLVRHALERRRLLRDNEALRNLVAMHRVRHAVDAFLDHRQGYDVFLRSVRTALTADLAGLYAGTSGGPHLLELGTGLSRDDRRSELGRTVARRVIDAGASLRFPDTHGEGMGLPPGIHGIVAVPVRREDGAVAGALVAMREKKPWRSSEEQLQMMDGLAREASALMTRGGALPDGGESHEEPTEATLRRLVTQLDHLEREPAGHSLRIAEFASRLASEIGLPGRKRQVLRTGALLHDVGKVSVRREVLRKAGPLTEGERHEVERHVEVGKGILRSLGIQEEVVSIVGAHHERYDGSGYPEGLRGEEIPLGGRILAIADTLEAMTFPRPYRAALTYDDVVVEISRRNTAKFDPDLVKAFLAIPRSEWEEIRECVASTSEPRDGGEPAGSEEADSTRAPRDRQAGG